MLVLPTVKMLPQLTEGHEAQFIIYALILLFLGVARQAEGERIWLFLRSFSNVTLVDQQIRQERSFSRLALIVFVFSLLALSVFVSLALQEHGYFREFNFTGLMLSSLVFFLLFTTARVALYSLVAWLFQLDELYQHHTFQWLLSNFVLCLFLLPLSIVYSFGPTIVAPYVIHAGLAALAIFYMMRIIRLFYAASSGHRVPLMYNFLYLCALEILPPLLVITVVSRQ